MVNAYLQEPRRLSTGIYHHYQWTDSSLYIRRLMSRDRSCSLLPGVTSGIYRVNNNCGMRLWTIKRGLIQLRSDRK